MVQMLLKSFLQPKIKMALFAILFLFISSASQAEILSHETSVTYKDYSSPKQEYNLIDDMDIYSLSPQAKLLFMPKMLSYNIEENFEIDLQNINWKQIIQAASEKYNLPEKLIYAVIKVESNFIHDAISNKGAQGAMQIMPKTAQDLGLQSPLDPKENVFAGTVYLKQQIDKFQTLELALAAYNAGPANVEKYNGIPPFKETQDFVQKVLANM